MAARVQLGPHAHRVARLMMIVGPWHSATRIGREGNVGRENVAYELARMCRARFVERRRARTIHTGYEWSLTPAGTAFALAEAPADQTGLRPIARYDHGALANALGLNNTISPPSGRLHLTR